MYSVSVNIADETETTVFVLFSKALSNSLFLFIQNSHRDSADTNQFIGFVCNPHLPDLCLLTDMYGPRNAFHKTTLHAAKVIGVDIQSDAKLFGCIYTKRSRDATHRFSQGHRGSAM